MRLSKFGGILLPNFKKYEDAREVIIDWEVDKKFHLDVLVMKPGGIFFEEQREYETLPEYQFDQEAMFDAFSYILKKNRALEERVDEQDAFICRIQDDLERTNIELSYLDSRLKNLEIANACI